MLVGSYQELLRTDTLAGRAMKQVLPVKETPRRPTGSLSVQDACLQNLKHVDVDIPLGIMTVVTGVAGSGKSALISQVFAKQYESDIVMVDQGPITATTVPSPPLIWVSSMKYASYWPERVVNQTVYLALTLPEPARCAYVRFQVRYGKRWPFVLARHGECG